MLDYVSKCNVLHEEPNRSGEEENVVSSSVERGTSNSHVLDVVDYQNDWVYICYHHIFFFLI